MDNLQQANKDGVVLGINEVAGVLPRLDIDVLLLKHPDVFNLLLIALMELKGDSVPWSIDDGYKFTKDDKTSYYQLAGIHGLPWTAWDGEVGKSSAKKDEDSPGYCAHGTPTFGPWHRPYLSLLEQTLYRQIANIAERFSRSTKITPERKQKYTEAVKSFRLPYWDYYRPRDGPTTFPGVKEGETTKAPYNYRAPWIFTEPKIMVKTLPDDELKSMDNPFLQWKFANGGLSDNEWKVSQVELNTAAMTEHTMRYSGLDAPAIQKLNDNLNKIREDELRKSLVMIELGVYEDYDVFSTTGVTVLLPDPKHPGQILKQPAGSIEGLHGNYHNYIGGYPGSIFEEKHNFDAGHMTSVPVAAFDPVFWFHHCQIDRLFAIWQAVNPDHWFEEVPERTDEGKVIKPPKSSDPLLPFRTFPLKTDPKERYWTSDLARDITKFGYNYPDLIDKKDATQIRDDFAANYGWSRRLQPYQPFGKPREDMLPLDLSQAQVFKDLAKPVSPILPPVASVSHRAKAQVPLSIKPTEVQTDKKVSYEWYIDNVVERMAMNGAFTIFFIIGDVSGASGVEWSRLPGFVGVNHIFTAPREACDNCGRQEEQATLVTGTSPITSLLLDYVENGSLESMSADHVAPFLVKNLKWRAQAVGGTVINPRELANEHSFRLSISCKTAPLPGQTGQVTYQTYPEIIQQIVANAS